MKKEIEEMALSLEPEMAKRVLWVICRMELDEYPLREDQLAEIILNASQDSYFAWEHYRLTPAAQEAELRTLLEETESLGKQTKRLIHSAIAKGQDYWLNPDHR